MSRLFRVQIAFTQTGANATSNVIRTISQSSNEANNAVKALRATLLTLISREAVTEIARLGDEILRLRNRLGFVTGDSTKTAEAFKLIQDAADETRGGLAATGDLYTRFALATRHMGLEAREVVDIVKTLNQIVVLSGSNAREAEQGLLQFSQGLASDRLAGDELRAVLEQIPLLSDVIGKELGVNRGALRFLAREGEISGQVVVNALQAVAKEMSENFSKTVYTTGQAATVLHNSMLRVLDDIDKSIGLFGHMSDVVRFLARNMEFFGRVILAGVVVAGIYAVVAAMELLFAAFLANPVGAFVLLLTSAVALLATFSDQILVIKDQGVTLADVLVVGFKAVRAELEPLLEFAYNYFVDNILPVLKELPGAVAEQLKSTTRDIAEFFDLVQNGLNGLGGAIGAGTVVIESGITTVIGKLRNAFLDFAEFIRDLFFGLINGISLGFKGLVGQIQVTADLLKLAFDSLQRGDYSIAVGAAKAAVESISKSFTEPPKLLAASLATEFSEDNFKQYRVPVVESAKSLGQALSDGFTQGFRERGEPALAFVNGVIQVLEGQAGNLQNAFERITRVTIDGAIQKAADRRADLALSNFFGGDGSFPAAKGDEGLKSLSDVVIGRTIDRLKEETDALSQDNRERRVQNDLIQINNYLRQNKGNPSGEEQKDIESLVRRKDAFQELQKIYADFQKVLPNTAQGFADLAKVEGELAEKTDFLLAIYRLGLISSVQLNEQLETLNGSYKRLAAVLEEIRDPAQAYEERMKAIGDATAYARTEQQKYNLEQLKTKAALDKLEGDTSAEAGIARGFLKLQQEITDTSKLIEQSIVGAFHNAEDALIDFVVNGKASFSDLAKSIAADLVKIGLRQFITGPLLGLLGSAFGGGALTPRAGGGPVQGGVDYLVGEQGPEILRINGNGHVTNSEDTKRVLGGRGGGDNKVVNVSMTVVTPDADSFHRSRDQLTRQLSSALRR